MTPEAERNLDYLKNSFERAGFGTIYHEQLEAGVRAGKQVVDFGIVDIPVNEKQTISYQPTVVEKPDNPGFYIFTDFKATKSDEGKPDISITIPHYKMTGMTVEQAKTLLNGGTVLHTEGEDANKVPKTYFSTIDTSKPVEEGKSPAIIRVAAKNFDLARLISKEDIVGDQKEKAIKFSNIQNGLNTQVTLRVRENGQSQYHKAILQLAIADNKALGGYDLALKVYDQSNKLLREHKQAAKAEKVLETGLRMRSATQENSLPADTLRMMAAKDAGQSPNKTKSAVKTPGS